MCSSIVVTYLIFFFNDTATTEIYTLSLHDALPISEPVVNFIVRSVDDILKTEFDLPQGLADTSKTKIKVPIQGSKKMQEKEVHKVQILDPATGTGTFLAEVVKYIYSKKFKAMQGAWSGYVDEHLIPRLNGFELLMASYSMAHLKLDMLLRDTGYKATKNQRFNIYLTNSLEEHHPDTGTLFSNWLSTEANEANHIKRDTPVMCVIGNPPYAVSSTNKSEWIQNLLKDYKKDLNERKINLERAHLEEDAGKNVHDLANCTGVDLNRAGVPLLEIVSEPDMNSPQEVMVYARAMRQLIRYLGVSEANMQHGHMRFEPNISLWIFDEAETDGGHYTPIVEVKNLNSFRALEKTVVFEIERQVNEWQADSQGYRMDKMSKQNRGWDDVQEVTVFQRHKEEADEYRYFPEPDLLPVEIDDAWLERIKAQVPELPIARYARFQKQFGFVFHDLNTEFLRSSWSPRFSVS